MITAVDTHVLLDDLVGDPVHGPSSRERLALCRREGPLVACEVVVAELGARFGGPRDLQAFLGDTGIQLERCPLAGLVQAGRAWRTYLQRRTVGCVECGERLELTCPRCGGAIRLRQHLVADFLIGGHALATADRLLTRDRGFYGTYFPDLRLGP